MDKLTSTLQSRIDGKDPALELWCAGYGCIPAKFMFVGISAGRLGAIKTQVPFTRGPSGRLLQRCLGMLGLSESDEFSIRPKLVNCYLTNLVKGVCLTDNGLNRLPTKKEIDFWVLPGSQEEIKQGLRAPRCFYEEVVEIEPSKIIALGNLVYESIKPHFPAETIKLNHPRWYESHGALANKENFERMVEDYSKTLGITIRKEYENSL